MNQEYGMLLKYIIIIVIIIIDKCLNKLIQIIQKLHKIYTL